MIAIDKSLKIPIYEQLYQNISTSIADGSLPEDSRLPATRKLAKELNISRNSVLSAYEQLVAEGYLRSKIGSGYVVNRINYLSELTPRSSTQKEFRAPISLVAASDSDFFYGTIDNTLFPYAKWKKCMLKAMDQIESQKKLTYISRTGEPELRKAIASYLFKTRGVACRPEQVVITPGHQYTMEYIAAFFSGKYRHFSIENPCYDGILPVFKNHQYEIHPIPVEKDGVSVDGIVCRQKQLLYLTPSHQFPLGCVLPISKRYLLIQWAVLSGSYIIEDDYDSEYRYYTNPIPALYSLDHNGHTIYTGTFSKSLAPNLRVAYMILPESLIAQYLNFFQRYNCPVSQHTQLTLFHFIKEGYYEKHINKMRLIYQEKRALFINSLDEIFEHRAEIIGDAAGVHFLVNIPTTLTQEQLLSAAKDAGITLQSTKPYYLPPAKAPENQLIFGFASAEDKHIVSYLQNLHQVWNALEH